MQNTPKRLVLNFAGRVTHVPSDGALPLCKVWGIDFYVDGKSYVSPSSEFFVPAWLVPVVTKKENTNSNQIGLIVEKTSDTFNFKWTQLGKPHKVIRLSL